LAAFEGCASLGASNAESLLSAACFRTRTPSTPKQRALYNQFTPYKLERRTKNGKVLKAAEINEAASLDWGTIGDLGRSGGSLILALRASLYWFTFDNA
jgi:hypothetical protein